MRKPPRRGRSFRRCLAHRVYIGAAVAVAAAGATFAEDAAPPRLVVPAGFVVEPAAGPPLVEHPMQACFDDAGRLYVTDAAGLNLPATELLQALPNRIRRLEDTDGDGRFDRAVTFADRLTFPMGVLWHAGSVYTCAHPSLWRLTDTDGDGVADRREEVVSRFGSVGNGADIHGPFLGPDGFLYWTDGRHGHRIPRPDGTVMEGKASRVFRCRTDGTDLEVVCGAGMDNPVEIAFLDTGEFFVTGNILSEDGEPRWDGIFHGVEGGVYPKHHPTIAEFRRTGPLLPAMVKLGWVAPAGLARYRSAVFDEAYRGNLFSAQFNAHRVQRHVLTRTGATFTATAEDFLTSADPDFHPTDVLEDADGSLLVLDTGGWFRIGCPTSKLAKPEVKGTIHRVRRRDIGPIADPRGTALRWAGVAPAELGDRLLDPRPVVRDRAQDRLRAAGADAITELWGCFQVEWEPERGALAAWALARIGGAAAFGPPEKGLHHYYNSEAARIAATRAFGLARDPEAVPGLLEAVVEDTTPVCREAATALGRIRDRRAVPALLLACGRDTSPFLDHALIYALIEIGDRKATAAGLADGFPRIRRAALIALDQMPGGNLAPEEVLPLLDSDDDALRDAALGVVASRPAWADGVADRLAAWLAEPAMPEARHLALAAVLRTMLGHPRVAAAVAAALERPEAPADRLAMLLATVADAGTAAPLPQLVAGVARCLAHADAGIRRRAVAAAEAAGRADWDAELDRMARDAAAPLDLRLAALRAGLARRKEFDDALAEVLASAWQEGADPLARLSAARIAARAPLTEPRRARLLPAVSTAGPLELGDLLAAFECGSAEAEGLALVKALAAAPGIDSLGDARVKAVLARFPPAVTAAAEPLLARLASAGGRRTARLRELAPALQGGDAARGRDVFANSRAACASCHAIQGQGGGVGPDLGAVGSIRAPADLLESIVFPGAGFVRGFETVIVTRADETIASGVLARETADAVVLRAADRRETRIPRAEIASLAPAPVSLMPEGLDALLTAEELRDLVAYLMSLK